MRTLGVHADAVHTAVLSALPYYQGDDMDCSSQATNDALHPIFLSPSMGTGRAMESIKEKLRVPEC